MALVSFLKIFYSIYMNRKMKLVILLVVCLFPAFPVFSQGKLPSLGKILSKEAPNYVGPELLRKNMGYIMPSSISKSFLNGIEPFARERAAANELYAEMEKNQTLNLTPGQFAALNNRIIRDIVNKSLKKYLTGSLTEKSYQQFMRDLANYYSLSVKYLTSYELRLINPDDAEEIFCQTALEYMKDHPHKINLKLREIMKSPFVTQEVKVILNHFIAQKEILPQHENALLTVLRKAYQEHSNGMAAALSSQEITATVQTYRSILEDLQRFVQQHNRSPRWNAPKEEQKLYNALLIMIHANAVNHFQAVNPYIEQIQQLLKAYPRIHLSKAETLEKLEDFYMINNRLPRVITEVPEGTVIPEAELELYESMLHWMSEDSSFTSIIRSKFYNSK